MSLRKMYKVRFAPKGKRPRIIRLDTEAQARRWGGDNPDFRYVGPVWVDQDGNERKR